MENINFNNSYFSSKKMIPEADDDLTALWGRRIVMNLVAGYGIIGTLYLEANSQVYQNLQLSLKFLAPPAITCYFSQNGGQLFNLPEQNDDIYIAVNTESIMFRNNTVNNYMIYFRINGL